MAKDNTGIFIILGVVVLAVGGYFCWNNESCGRPLRKLFADLKFPKKFEGPLGPEGAMVPTRAPYSQSPSTPGSLMGAGNQGRTSSTGYGPSSSFVRYAYQSANSRISLV